MLLTAPIRDWQVVAAKFIAAMGFYVILWLPTLLYLPVLIGLQRIELHRAWSENAIQMVSGLAAIVLIAVLMMLPARPGFKLTLYMLPNIILAVAATAVFVAYGYQLFAAVLAVALAVNMVLFVAAPIGIGKLFGYSLESLVAFVLTIGLLLATAHAAYYGWKHFVRDDVSLIQIVSRIDHWPVVTSYLGVMLVGAMFLAIGMLVSSLVKSQMVSALISLVLSLVFVLPAFWRPEMDTASLDYRIRNFFSVPVHFHHDFTRGLIDSRNLILYASVALCCLFLTVRSLESRRWR
jgi:hypothetical protein